ncbi:MAG TPA: non-homologous end-joining DNA ligase [Nocardioidaceae bacterium]|nr:non-homologous end-joining DNA ligase [Nocardioidaceae bacterium]
MRPMLASRGTSVPTGAEWLHEVKWDGMRVLAEVRDGRLTLWSRNENDVTVSFPELLDFGVLAAHDVLLDGEVVAMAGGIPTFGALADRMHVSSAARARRLAESNPVTLIVFDVLRLDGRDLTGEPLEARRAELEALGIGSAHWLVPPVYDDGPMLLDATKQQGLEGIVSKKRSSTYQFGRRTKDWLKFPHRPTLSYVVGGWRRETGSDSRLGALLVGAPTPQGLSYRGRVGSGIVGRTAQQLLEVLEPLHAERSPFCDEVPRVDALGTVWVRPEVVVEIAALGVTNGGRLRQPSYQGIRFDLTPADVKE